MEKEKPITLEDIEAVFRRPVKTQQPFKTQKNKCMGKRGFELDRHYKLLDKIIRSL